MNQQPPSRRRPTRRQAAKRARNRRLASLGVLALLVVVVLIIALIISLRNREEAVSSSSHSLSTVHIEASTPQREKYEVPVVGPYDEPGIPLLTSPDRHIPEDYTFELADIGGGFQLDSRAAPAYLAMQAAAAKDGVTLSPVSAWRSNERQTNNYNNSIQNYMAQGYSEEEATRLTRRYYALPGTSEHEVGLAVDINSLEESFENTAAFAWLQEHCGEYGFIVRYLRETETTTGIAYEPWHYRYVGTNHAKAIKDLGLNTLEEYVWMLEEQETW